MPKTSRGGGKTLSYLLAGLVTLAAFGTRAADVTWTGGSGGTEAEPLDLYNAANWSNKALPSSGNKYYLTVDSPTVLTNSAPINTQIANWFSPYSGDFTFLGPMTVGVFCWDPSSANATIVKKGDWTIKWDFDIAHAANSYVVITNVSGNMTKTDSSSDLQIGAGNNSIGIVENLSGDWTLPRHIYLGLREESTGIVESHSGDWKVLSKLYLGYGTGSRGEFTLNGGSLNVSSDLTAGQGSGATGLLAVNGGVVSISGDMYIGSKGNGTLTINGGTVEVGSSTTEKWTKLGDVAGSTGTINLNGGKLKLWHLRKGDGEASLVFNGGTLVANGVSKSRLIASDLSVTVNPDGGAIDNNGRAITLNALISGKGGMKFCGGGTTTLSRANNYEGATEVELGTKIIATTPDAKASVLGNLVVAGVAEDGDYTVFEYSADILTEDDLANVSCPGGAEGTAISLGENNKSIVVHYVAPAEDIIWNGGDGVWADANAWTNVTGIAKTWSDGNYAVFATDNVVTLGADVAALLVRFNADAAVEAGGGTLRAPVVDVKSGVFATIVAPTAGELEKTGAGTLKLGSSRTETTMLSAGTLEINGDGTTLNWSKFKFGTGNTLRVAGGASITYDYYIIVGDTANNNATLEITGASSKVVSTAYYMSIGDSKSTSGTVTLTDGGKYENTGSGHDGGGLIVGSKGAGVLNVNGGEVTMTVPINLCYNSGSSAEVNIGNGGKVCANGFIYNRGGSGSPTAAITMDGGTLKATADNAAFIPDASNMTVIVGSNGGTIDAAGYAITIAKTISGAGGMTYQGGGKVTLTAQPTYTGITTVEVGTTLVIPEAIAGDMVFSVPGELADGIYTVVSISGESQFEDNVVDGKEGFVLSSDKRKICYVKGTGVDTTKPVYIGTDGNLSAAGNWLDGTVPTGGTGDAQIFCASASTLMVGDTFAPAKLVIPDGSALVTIGSGTLYVGEVVNRNLLVVGAGATVVIGNQLTLGKGETICDHINGTLVVSNLLLKAEKGDRYVTRNQEASVPGVFKFETITNSMANSWFYFADKTRATTNVVYIGKGGLNFLNASGSASYCLGGTESACSTTIRPWYGDFAIEDSGTGKYSLALLRDVTFCTDDENGIGRTITLNGKTFADNYSPKITVSGSGTLQVNNGNVNLVQPPVTVNDTATLAFAAGASLSTGEITLGAGTTLALTATSREFTPLANTLNLPTEGKAKIRINGARLRSGDHVIATLGEGSGTADNVELDSENSGSALGGRRARFEVDEHGKLLLNIKSSGTRIIIR